MFERTDRLALADPAAAAAQLERRGVRLHEQGGERFVVFPG